MPFIFESLRAYQLAVDLADQVIEATRDAGRGHGHLVSQLTRASVSIAANVAEGNGRASPKDRRHFFMVARGSTHECVPLLELARRHGIVGEEAVEPLRTMLDELGRTINGLARRAEAQIEAESKG